MFKIYFALSASLFWGQVHAQDLRVDFTQSGGPIEAGYEGYFADHEVSASFTTQSFSAFGGTVTLTPIWADDTVTPPVDGTNVILDGANNAKQLIKRGQGTPSPDLYQDWIGLDGRVAEGNPFNLVVGGVPAGSYILVTHHHDPENQTGLVDLTVTDADGDGAPLTIDQSAAGDNPTVVNVPFTSDGSDVVFSYSNQLAAGGGGPVGEVFIVLNAIEIVTSDDTDGDGLPDFYETANGLDPDDDGSAGESSPGTKDGPNGALGDPDMDGLTNLDEYQGEDGTPGTGDETDPQDEDTDDDLVLDGSEIDGSANAAFGNESTDPLDPDSDDDGIMDGDEISGVLNIANNNEPTDPTVDDTDDDGMTDDG